MRFALPALALIACATLAWSQTGNQSGNTTRITNAFLAQMPAKTVKCNDSALAANVTDCKGLPNDLLSQMPGSTVKCNDTGSSANAADCLHIAFYLHKNGVNQTGLTTGAYNRLTWSTAKFNNGGGIFSGNTWTAPVAGFVFMNATAWCSLNCLNTPNASNPLFVMKIIKNSAGTCNGADVFAGTGAPGLGGGVNEAVAQANGIDQASANDVYEACLFPTSSDAMNDVQVDGNQAHTHWSGAYIR